MGRIAIIAGTGFRELDIPTSAEVVDMDTPFGQPSGPILRWKDLDHDIFFLPRHGLDGSKPPHKVNYRANLWAMKKLGVHWIISSSAVGSLQKKYHACDIVLINQFLDRTKQSANHTFFGNGIAAHIAFADPICEELRQLLLKCVKRQKTRVHNGGTYVNMEGPAFSTRAESLTNHKLKYDVIGMTNLGEAKCAREAEIAYATMAMITDYDCWKTDEAHVTVEMVIDNLTRNAATAKAVLTDVIPRIPQTPANWPCHAALQNAIMTDRKVWPTKTIKDLKPILAKYL